MNSKCIVLFFVPTLALIVLSGCTSYESCCTVEEPPANTLTAQEKSGGWRLLWDGKTTDGWRSAWMLRHPAVNDLVTADEAREDWQLKIESSRAKKDWDVGRMILYNERYYRIESVVRIESARPFVYLLRSLPAGVPRTAAIAERFRRRYGTYEP